MGNTIKLSDWSIDWPGYGADNVESAQLLCREAAEILKGAGIHIRKWELNDSKLLSYVTWLRTRISPRVSGNSLAHSMFVASKGEQSTHDTHERWKQHWPEARFAKLPKHPSTFRHCWPWNYAYKSNSLFLFPFVPEPDHIGILQAFVFSVWVFLCVVVFRCRRVSPPHELHISPLISPFRTFGRRPYLFESLKLRFHTPRQRTFKSRWANKIELSSFLF